MNLRTLSFWSGVLHTLLYLLSLIALAVLVGRGDVSPGQLVVPLTMVPCLHMAVCVEMAFSAHKCESFGLAVWLAWFAVWLPLMSVGLVWLVVCWLAEGSQLEVALAGLCLVLLVLLWPPYVVVGMYFSELRNKERAKAGA